MAPEWTLSVTSWDIFAGRLLFQDFILPSALPLLFTHADPSFPRTCQHPRRVPTPDRCLVWFLYQEATSQSINSANSLSTSNLGQIASSHRSVLTAPDTLWPRVLCLHPHLPPRYIYLYTLLFILLQRYTLSVSLCHVHSKRAEILLFAQWTKCLKQWTKCIRVSLFVCLCLFNKWVSSFTLRFPLPSTRKGEAPCRTESADSIVGNDIAQPPPRQFSAYLRVHMCASCYGWNLAL